MYRMRTLLRPVAVAATGVVVATTLTTTAQAAPADRADRWLQRQLTDGVIHNAQYDFDDYGLTADVGIALDALNERRAVRRIARALDDHVDSWTTGADFGSPDDVYAGSVAKALVLAQSAERNPRRFGGVDLVERLEERVSTTKPYVGRIQDSGAQDYANTIGQAFAAVGLADARSDRARHALRFLLRQQCDAGWFRLNFAPTDARRQGCEGGGEELSVPDTDVTALSLLILDNLPRKPRRVRRAIDNATDWLVGEQKRNGSFGGGTSTRGSNTNSTGLAAWALGDSGTCRPAVRAAKWVRKRQVRGKVRGTPYAGEKGAIAYDRAAFRAGRDEGITTETRDQWRRATSQAAPGLRFTSLRRCRR